MRYRAGYKYQLATKERFSNTGVKPPCVLQTRWLRLYPNGLLEIESGYCWDGASGPAIDTGFSGLLANSMRASLAHDALYQLMRLKLLDRIWREEADLYLDAILKKDGMGFLRRWYWLKGVRLFAAGAAKPGTAKPILLAP
jgi:hypothetical protein